MATGSKIRVGIIGVSPQRGFASIAHIPALQALPEFEISAICTTRQDSADAAAKHFGIPLAFSDAEKLAQHPDVDLVTVSVRCRIITSRSWPRSRRENMCIANGLSVAIPTRPPGCSVRRSARASGMWSGSRAK